MSKKQYVVLYEPDDEDPYVFGTFASFREADAWAKKDAASIAKQLCEELDTPQYAVDHAGKGVYIIDFYATWTVHELQHIKETCNEKTGNNKSDR